MLFTDIIGQDKVVKILKRLITAKHFLPLIFVGQPGVGKRTLAIKLAQAINCDKRKELTCSGCSSCNKISNLNHPDIHLVIPIRNPSADSKSEDVIAEMVKHYSDFALGKSQPPIPANYTIPINAIRWLASEMTKHPVSAQKRFYIILNAHKMNAEAQNALLKILEEPQHNTIFILTTVNHYALYPTIRSRCQIIRFANIQESDIVNFIKNKKILPENPPTNIDPMLVATLAQGSLGRALSIYKNFADFAVTPLLDFIKNPSTQPISCVLAELKHAEPSLIINTALHVICKRVSDFVSTCSSEFDRTPHNKLITLQTLIEKLTYFYNRYHLSSLNVNSTLANYCTLKKIQPPNYSTTAT
ncbi:MAG: hypothetical protein N2248_03470 [candidate division WOR-3 bacterium]|uniref:DNA polymerase III subunit delta n=1 Tax=candidate division WOR-3 bacterium TaxID=2052148 RepID=A0A7C1SC97_UNCW3|nr:hypothetical protein [candidate division WOR-3 bacterium]